MTQKNVSKTKSEDEIEAVEETEVPISPVKARLATEAELYNKRYSVPEGCLSPFNNGRFSGTSIKPQWIIESLTDMFGLCGYGWYYEIVRTWMEKNEREIKSFVEINLYYRIRDPSGDSTKDEWSKPIHGTGGNTFVNSKGILDDDCFKKAETDALSKASQKLGIGGEIYMGFEKDKYTDPISYSDNSKSGAVVCDREFCIDTINEKFIIPEFRAKLKEYVRSKGKKTHDELSDEQLIEFITSQR